MKTLTIEVRQHHIDGGEPTDSRLCPVARAIMEQHPCYDVSVCNTHVFRRETKESDPEVYSLPAEANAFINDFDRRKVVDPLVFSATMYSSLDELNENIKKYHQYSKLTHLHI